MDQSDRIELSLFRALRGEVPPSVRAVSARIVQGEVELAVFCHRRDFDTASFEEVVLSELDQIVPTRDAVPVRVSFDYRQANEFQPTPAERVLVNNPWSE